MKPIQMIQELKDRESNNDGFALPEVFIALAILAISMLAVASMQVASISGNGKAMGVSDAATLGMDRVEILMNLAYDDTQLNAGSYSVSAPPGYRVAYTVADNESVRNSKTIRVVVTRWVETRPATLTITSLKVNPNA
jgi:prepilin-type N-terminal cleavage/methylation domain-containing protein